MAIYGESPETATEFHLLEELKRGDALDEETRGRILQALLPKAAAEKKGENFLHMFRHALETKDIRELRYVVDKLKTQMEEHSGRLEKCSPPEEAALQDWLEGKERNLCIAIVTGTHGHRIYISKSDIWMSEDRHAVKELSLFREIFGLSKDAEPRVSF